MLEAWECGGFGEGDDILLGVFGFSVVCGFYLKVMGVFGRGYEW